MDEHGLAEGILTDDLEFLCAVEEEIHPCYCRGGQVLFLPVDFAIRGFLVLHVADGLDQHAAGPAGGVIHRFAGLGLQQTNHQVDHRPRRVEFPGVLLAHISELFDQVFIRVAHHVGGIIPVADRKRGHVLDQIL